MLSGSTGSASDFRPEKIPVTEFPHAAGSGVRGWSGMTATVIDRGGDVFLACCAAHERAGTASGFYPQRSNGRILSSFEARGLPPDDCGRDKEPVPLTGADVGTILSCGCEVIRGNLACDYHAERWGPAQPDCGDCDFGVPLAYHDCGAL